MSEHDYRPRGERLTERELIEWRQELLRETELMRQTLRVISEQLAEIHRRRARQDHLLILIAASVILSALGLQVDLPT